MGGKGSGRKFKDVNTRQVQQTLQEAAVDAVKLIRNYVRGKDEHGNKVSITAVKLTAATLCIAHAIGLPRQKVEYSHTGDQLTLKDLAELAEQHDLLLLKSVVEKSTLTKNVNPNTQKSDTKPTHKLIPTTPKTSEN